MRLPEVWPAPAKINWFLHVVGKREDGYHELQTVFQFLDYGDDLRFAINQHGTIARDYDYGFSEQQDICLRAARKLQEISKTPLGVTISLQKRLPMGGGLGGGSSDAATTLIALNRLWGLGLSCEKLAEIGLILGADVPVFVMGQAAWAEGVGEQLTPVSLSEHCFLVATPKVHVSTKQIFCNKQLTAAPQMLKIRALEKGIELGFGENQLESIVRVQYPQVDALLEWLSEYGKPRMSGSGSSVFMAVENALDGQALLSRMPAGVSGFVANGINQHPLLNC